jgi:hypothetical protein
MCVFKAVNTEDNSDIHKKKVAGQLVTRVHIHILLPSARSPFNDHLQLHIICKLYNFNSNYFYKLALNFLLLSSETSSCLPLTIVSFDLTHFENADKVIYLGTVRLN